jgi:hypothetical protein
MTTSTVPYLTPGEVAVCLGVRDWQVLRLFQRGLLPEPPRLGRNRAIPAGDLDRVRQALVAAGYLTEAAPALADGGGERTSAGVCGQPRG